MDSCFRRNDREKTLDGETRCHPRASHKSSRVGEVVTEPTNNQCMPFVVSPSNHERPFDKLRANGTKGGGFHCVTPTLLLKWQDFVRRIRAR